MAGLQKFFIKHNSCVGYILDVFGITGEQRWAERFEKKPRKNLAASLVSLIMGKNKEESSNKYVVICTHCRKEFFPKISTTGLKHHLSRHVGVKASGFAKRTHGVRSFFHLINNEWRKVGICMFRFIVINGHLPCDQFVQYHQIQ